MLYITNQENAISNHKNISPHTCWNGCYQNDKKITSVGKDAEKKEVLFTVVGM
jgi:hypothetical protein